MDNGPHRKDDVERFVLISFAALIHDFSRAMELFIAKIATNAGLNRQLDSRIGSLFFTSLIGP
jgi:hypothetical protein